MGENQQRLKKVLERFDGKKVLLMGYGREGKASLEKFQELVPTVRITVSDVKEQILPEGVEGVFGQKYQDNLTSYDAIIKSPGIVLKDRSPEVLSRLTSQTELFLEAYRDQVIGITGTKGKSTTTSLIWHVLKSVRPDTLLMGNIGIPAFLQADKIQKDTLIVYELSCHQLEFTHVSPHIAILLNLFEDHLDHYGTLEAYFDAKRNIARFQKEGDLFFVNYLQRKDVPECRGDIFTMQQKVCSQASLSVEGRKVCFDEHTLFLAEGCTSLVGEHNLYNIGVAYGVCHKLGVSDDSFMAALKTFVSLPHRLQRVGTFEDVTYYDDSISTACETAIGGLKALEKDGVGSILLGGMDRGIDYTPLVEYLIRTPSNNPSYLILMPDSGIRVAQMLREKGFDEKRMILVENLEEAVRKAKKITPKGTACLLSPAAASYGFFKNFEERGDRFQELVRKV